MLASSSAAAAPAAEAALRMVLVVHAPQAHLGRTAAADTHAVGIQGNLACSWRCALDTSVINVSMSAANAARLVDGNSTTVTGLSW